MMEISYFAVSDATRLLLRPETKVEEDVLKRFVSAQVEFDTDCGKPVLVITRIE